MKECGLVTRYCSMMNCLLGNVERGRETESHKEREKSRKRETKCRGEREGGQGKRDINQLCFFSDVY